MKIQLIEGFRALHSVRKLSKSNEVDFREQLNDNFQFLTKKLKIPSRGAMTLISAELIRKTTSSVVVTNRVYKFQCGIHLYNGFDQNHRLALKRLLRAFGTLSETSSPIEKTSIEFASMLNSFISHHPNTFRYQLKSILSEEKSFPIEKRLAQNCCLQLYLKLLEAGYTPTKKPHKNENLTQNNQSILSELKSMFGLSPTADTTSAEILKLMEIFPFETSQQKFYANALVDHLVLHAGLKSISKLQEIYPGQPRELSKLSRFLGESITLQVTIDELLHDSKDTGAPAISAILFSMTPEELNEIRVICSRNRFEKAPENVDSVESNSIQVSETTLEKLTELISIIQTYQPASESKNQTLFWLQRISVECQETRFDNTEKSRSIGKLL